METLSTKRIAFGACNRQFLPQHFWKNISDSFNPYLFIWTGDAVYSKNHKLSGLESSFNFLLDSLEYKAFSSSRFIDGIWDDHDLGVNDGGRYVSDSTGRKKAFSNFLSQFQKNSINFPNLDDGLYHSRIESINNVEICFIFLDTRSNRDDHIIPSLATIKSPLTALFSAGFRTFYSYFGIGKDYSGDILGESQWQWLENTLSTSTASFHVIISSIQIFSSNPTVESWGHFPHSKKRLISLVSEHDPKGLVFISGDVHHAEFSSLPVIRMKKKNENQKKLTSSKHKHNNTYNKMMMKKKKIKGNEKENSKDTDDDEEDLNLHLKTKTSSNPEVVGKIVEVVEKETGSQKSNQEEAAEAAAEEEEVGGGEDYFSLSHWVEVTSSGLTHSCVDSRLHKHLCPAMLSIFHSHRMSLEREERESSNSTVVQELAKRMNLTLIQDKDYFFPHPPKGLSGTSPPSPLPMHQGLSYLGKNFGLIELVGPLSSTSKSSSSSSSTTSASCSSSSSSSSCSTSSIITSDTVSQLFLNISIISLVDGQAKMSVIIPSSSPAPTPSPSPSPSQIICVDQRASQFPTLWDCIFPSPSSSSSSSSSSISCSELLPSPESCSMQLACIVLTLLVLTVLGACLGSNLLLHGGIWKKSKSSSSSSSPCSPSSPGSVRAGFIERENCNAEKRGKQRRGEERREVEK